MIFIGRWYELPLVLSHYCFSEKKVIRPENTVLHRRTQPNLDYSECVTWSDCNQSSELTVPFDQLGDLK